MVADDHQITYAEGLVDTTCGVGDEEVLDTEELHHADGEGDLLHGVAFVVVEAPLHAQHGYAREGTSDEIPLMADSRRVWEVGDLCVGDDGGILEHVAELAKALPRMMAVLISFGRRDAR